jgi:hypothetical protein
VFDGPGENTESGHVWSFGRAVVEPLHADAYAEKGHASVHTFEDGGAEWIEGTCAPEMADAWKNEGCGGGDYTGIAGDAGLDAEVLKRIDDGSEVASLVVDQDQRH